MLERSKQEVKQTNNGYPIFDKGLLVIIVVFFLQWLLLFRMAGPTWDEAFYYLYARSVVFDQDLQLQNDFILSYETASPDFIAKEYHTNLTVKGRVANPFAIGSSVLWMPWMTTVRIIVELVQPLGLLHGVKSGFEWPFTGGMGVFSAICGLLAFILSYYIARKETNEKCALLSTLTLMFATPLIYYQFREPMYAHAMSAFATTLVIYIWQRQYQNLGTPMQAALLGGTIGLSGLVRWQNVLYLALPFVSAVYWWLVLPRTQKRHSWQRILIYLTVVGCSAVLLFSLQMSVWKLFYGSWTTIPQGAGFMDWRAPFIHQVLFSTFHGLLTWMPVFSLALFGLIYAGRNKLSLVLPLLIILVLEIYVNGSVRDWFGAGGFGPRRFTSELVIIVLGYAKFIELMSKRIRLFVGSLLGVFFAFYNWTLLRYAIPEQLGGHVVSMHPDFRWADETFMTFFSTLIERLMNAFRQPMDFWILPESPVYMIVNQHMFPIKSLVALLGTTLFMLISWYGGRWIRKRLKIYLSTDYKFLILVILTILVANFWVLFQA